MASEIRPELLSFLQPSANPWRILVIESLGYMAKLCEMFPAAEINVVAADNDELRVVTDGDNIIKANVDYLSVPLPYERGSFDFIIADLLLEEAANPQDIAAGIAFFLKETGFLLTSFRNIRHWSVVQNLLEGHYYGIVSRLFAKPEFENLLYASFYKNVRLRAQQRSAPADILRNLLAAGFENINDDLENEFYLVRADRSMPEIALLKSMFNKDERKQLARLLHRVEYKVETEVSGIELWELTARLNIFPEYLAAFERETVVHTERFYRSLWELAYGHEEYILAMLNASAIDTYSPENSALYQLLGENFRNGYNDEQ